MGSYKEELARFKAMVRERGEKLRSMSLSELEQAGEQPAERIALGTRTGSIAIIVERPIFPKHEARRVVVQGFMDHRMMPGKSVALDGFYKYPDGTTEAMQSRELWNYD